MTDPAQVMALPIARQLLVAVTVTPEWARLLDFETTAPAAVEKLIRERAQPEAGGR